MWSIVTHESHENIKYIFAILKVTFKLLMNINELIIYALSVCYRKPSVMCHVRNSMITISTSLLSMLVVESNFWIGSEYCGKWQQLKFADIKLFHEGMKVFVSYYFIYFTLTSQTSIQYSIFLSDSGKIINKIIKELWHVQY